MDCSIPGFPVLHYLPDYIIIIPVPIHIVYIDSRAWWLNILSLNIWKFTVHILLKPGLENFEDYFTSVWDECNCAVVWAFFGISSLWDWNENWPFPVLWPLLSFPNLLAYWVQHFHGIIFQDLEAAIMFYKSIVINKLWPPLYPTE